MDDESSRHNRLESILKDRSLEPQSVPLEDLREITQDFSVERLLGEGGFGKVYKGALQNGSMVAVKKFTCVIPGIQDRHFENEVHHLMRLKHPNIVQLVGYCSETEKELVLHEGKYIYADKPERLLCLEYIPKGSLRGYLSDESSGLGWDTRYKIIKGICYGLHYLHETWEVTPIIHMDLKPTNILLDNNMVPKIADFGLSRLFGKEQTRVCTTSRDGTLGYMAPEYLNRGIITKKLDIFSLGVIIIEIMTGHKDYPDETETSSQEFVELVHKNWRNRLEKAPSYTSRELDCQQVRRCIQIGLDCVKLDRTKRPTTHQIINLLHGLEGAECSNEREDFLRPPHSIQKSEGSTGRMTASSDGYSSVDTQRREKRRQSNREWARRSRLRKQQHLDELVGEIAWLQSQNAHMASQTTVIRAKCACVNQENSGLRAAAAELRDRLEALNEIVHLIHYKKCNY